jgi:peptidyl-prolyl cis-trans isomerase B (cyclophilin B)
LAVFQGASEAPIPPHFLLATKHMLFRGQDTRVDQPVEQSAICNFSFFLSFPLASQLLQRRVNAEMLNDIRITIRTAKGDIGATILPSKAPITAANFLNLASRKFYDGLTFHRVVPRFVIQGGDPLGNGTGGPGYRFENEIHPSLSHHNVGVLAMANAGPNTNGSQFYITIDSLRPEHAKMLDGNYSIFGQVTSGLDVATKIVQGDKIQSIDVLDSTEALFGDQKSRLKEWNRILDQKFGNRLAPAEASR